jgi:hypothetical protein
MTAAVATNAVSGTAAVNAANVTTGSLLAGKKQIDAGKEAAIEAEVRAARERAVVPLELRVKQFREMLQEKDVSNLFVDKRGKILSCPDCRKRFPTNGPCYYDSSLIFMNF